MQKIIKYFKQNDDENTACQNLWDIDKEMFRMKFITSKDYLRKDR